MVVAAFADLPPLAAISNWSAQAVLGTIAEYLYILYIAPFAAAAVAAGALLESRTVAADSTAAEADAAVADLSDAPVLLQFVDEQIMNRSTFEHVQNCSSSSLLAKSRSDLLSPSA